MKTLKILIDVDPDPASLEALRRMPGVDEVQVVPPNVDGAKEMPVADLKGKNVLFGCYPPLNLHDCDQLGLIQISSAGYGQLYGLDLPQRGIRACNVLGALDVPIAEWNVAMIINLARDFRSMVRNQEAGVWDRDARFQREVRGLVVGFWGYGGLGRATARLVKAMGMKVHVLTRSGVKRRDNIFCVPGTGDAEGVLPDRVFLLPEKDEFLGGLDFLIVAVPQTEVTKGIIGENELKALPRRAFVLNPARGPIIEEAALLRALREGWIAGAALDTHYHYPMPKGHLLWQFPNVIMTPHISGSGLSPYYLPRIWDIFLQNARHYQLGEPLLNELSAAQLSGG